MFEYFSESAKKAVADAQGHARAMSSETVGVDHLSLGILSLRDTVAFRCLVFMGVGVNRIWDQVLQRAEAEAGPRPSGGHPPFDQSVQWALADAFRESITLSHARVNTGHLLLALADGPFELILAEAGATIEELRQVVKGGNAPRAARRCGGEGDRPG